MSKDPRRGRRKSGARFIKLDWWLTQCPPWLELTPDELRVLLLIWAKYTGFNNGKIAFAMREGARAGLSTPRVNNAISGRPIVSRSTGKPKIIDREGGLIAKGWLRVTSDSTFDQKRLAREYEITALPVSEGKAAARDFMLPASVRDVPRKKSNHSLAGETHSLAGETENAKIASTVQSLSRGRDCSAEIERSHSLAGETHLDLSHVGSGEEQVPVVRLRPQRISHPRTVRSKETGK